MNTGKTFKESVIEFLESLQNPTNGKPDDDTPSQNENDSSEEIELTDSDDEYDTDDTDTNIWYSDSDSDSSTIHNDEEEGYSHSDDNSEDDDEADDEDNREDDTSSSTSSNNMFFNKDEDDDDTVSMSDDELDNDDNNSENTSSTDNLFNFPKNKNVANILDSDSDSNGNHDDAQGNTESSDESVTYETLPLEEPTLRHMHTGIPYYHIPLFEPKLTLKNVEKVTMYVYGYIICNNTYSDPYLSCLLEYDTSAKFYRLPKIEYKCAYNAKHETELRNQCFELLFPILNVNPGNVEDDILGRSEKAFQGFHYKNGTSYGCIGVNLQEFIPFLNKQSNASTLSEYFHDPSRQKDGIPTHSWGIVDELVETQTLLNIPIDPMIKTLFNEHSWYHEIVNREGEPTAIPKSLYSENNEPLTRTPDNESRALYLFTREFSGSEETPFETKRFVVFPVFQSDKKNDDGVFGCMSRGDFREF